MLQSCVITASHVHHTCFCLYRRYLTPRREAIYRSRLFPLAGEGIDFWLGSFSTDYSNKECTKQNAA